MNIYLTCCINVDTPILTNHFLKYYKELGIENFLIIINSKTEDNPNLQKTKEILSHNGIIPEIWIGLYDVYTYRQKRLALQYKHCKSNDWVIGVDLDEFIELPPIFKTFKEFLESNDLHGYSYVKGIFVDRLSSDGELKELQELPDISIQFPIKCDITKSILKACIDKIVAHKGNIETGTGHHVLSWSKEYDMYSLTHYHDILNVNHYKWDDTVISRIKKFALNNDYANIDDAWYTEGNRFLNYISKYGKIDISNISQS